MRPSLTVVDDFIPEQLALDLRQEVLKTGFEDLPYMGGLYQGTCIKVDDTVLKNAISAIFGGLAHVHISAFRSGHKETHLHVNIHADNSIGQKETGRDCEWAGVYYMNLPEDCKGGTAFYRMKVTGWDQMPTQEEMKGKDLTLDEVKAKWERPEDWDLVTLAGMKFNRFIYYPTRHFHSRYPLDGWGDRGEPEHARLVWVVFFDVM